MRHYKRYTIVEIVTILEGFDQNGKRKRACDLMPGWRTLGSLHKKRRQLMEQVPNITFIDECVQQELPTDEEIYGYKKANAYPDGCSSMKQKLIERMNLPKYPYEPEVLSKIITLYNMYGTSIKEIWQLLREEGYHTCRKTLKREIDFLKSL